MIRAVVLVLTPMVAQAAACTGGIPIGGMEDSFVKGDGGRVLGGNLTLQHNSGFSIMKSCQANWDPADFSLFRLLGRTLSFTVDLSSIGCACNIALYLVHGPARSSNGAPSAGTCSWSPYYCDANRVCGQWCPEVDIMEANNRVFSSTPHKCDHPTSAGHYRSCDRTGCSRNTMDAGALAYGPGQRFSINSLLPFEVLTTFHGNEAAPGFATFTGMTTKLRQGDRDVSLDFSVCGDYLSYLADAMAEGMAMRITYWGGDASTMSGLDQPPCPANASCTIHNSGTATISNMKVTSACRSDLDIRGVSGSSFATGFNGNASGGHLELHHDSGHSIMETCEDWNPNRFRLFHLLGKTLSFNVDLSQVGCNCNIALYLIHGPARDWSGNPSQGGCPRSPYYCDANRVCGQWCPEVDVMEANKHVFQATPHRCDEPSATGHYSNCDRRGCQQSTRSLGDKAYGPGPQFTIDTRRPFTVQTTFHGTVRSKVPHFTGLTTRLQQAANELVMHHSQCSEGYLETMAHAMAGGMSMRITYWGDEAKTMRWLDQPGCGNNSCAGHNAGKAAISSIRVSNSLVEPISGDDSWSKQHEAASLPWWVFAFVWISAFQTCLLCGLGVIAVHLYRQIARPSALRHPSLTRNSSLANQLASAGPFASGSFTARNITSAANDFGAFASHTSRGAAERTLTAFQFLRAGSNLSMVPAWGSARFSVTNVQGGGIAEAQ